MAIFTFSRACAIFDRCFKFSAGDAPIAPSARGPFPVLKMPSTGGAPGRTTTCGGPIYMRLASIIDGRDIGAEGGRIIAPVFGPATGQNLRELPHATINERDEGTSATARLSTGAIFPGAQPQTCATAQTPSRGSSSWNRQAASRSGERSEKAPWS